MAHQQARERWQPDSPALLECDRRAVNLHLELRSQAVIRIRVLKRVQELPSKLAELIALLLAQAGKQLTGVGALALGGERRTD